MIKRVRFIELVLNTSWSQAAGTTPHVTELVAHEVEVAFASESVDDEPDHLVKGDAAFDNRTRKIEVRHSWQEKKFNSVKDLRLRSSLPSVRQCDGPTL